VVKVDGGTPQKGVAIVVKGHDKKKWIGVVPSILSRWYKRFVKFLVS